jgi:hypothetical protein
MGSLVSHAWSSFWFCLGSEQTYTIFFVCILMLLRRKDAALFLFPFRIFVCILMLLRRKDATSCFFFVFLLFVFLNNVNN